MNRKEFVGATLAGSAVLAATPEAVAAADHPVDAFVTGMMHKYEIPTGAVAVAKDGRLVHARAFGYRDLAKTVPVKPQDRFRIASSSKPFTAVAIMQLVETGKLHLDDRAFDILSDFAPPSGAKEDPRLRTITVRQLLEHSGGFDSTKSDVQFNGLRTAAAALGQPAPATHTDLIKYMMGQPLAFDPGTKYVYSNLGYNILGRIVEHFGGSDYGTLVKAMLAPAGVTRMELGRNKPKDMLPDEVEAWDDPNWNTMYSVYEDDLDVRPYSYGGFSMEAIDAHGGWVASVLDLTRFLNAVNGSHGHQLLKPETVKTMLAKPNLAQYRTATHYYGFGWDVSQGILMNHNGAITWGTASTIGRLTYAICYNRLGYDIKNFVIEMMQTSAKTIAAVPSWPSGDLYTRYGPLSS